MLTTEAGTTIFRLHLITAMASLRGFLLKPRHDNVSDSPMDLRCSKALSKKDKPGGEVSMAWEWGHGTSTKMLRVLQFK